MESERLIETILTLVEDMAEFQKLILKQIEQLEDCVFELHSDYL